MDQVLQQAVAAHKKGNLNEAERLYRAILQSHPLHADANHNLGVLAVSVDKADEALSFFKTALEANPKIEQFWLSLLNALIKAEKFEAAKEVISRSKQQGMYTDKMEDLEKNGIESPNQQQLDKLLATYQAGQYDEAEALANSLTQDFPQHAFGWKVLGAILRQTGRESDSELFYRKAIEFSPHDPDVHFNLGNLLKEFARYDEARQSYRTAVSLRATFAEAHNNLGSTFILLDDFNEAIASFGRAIEAKPDYPEAHYNLGNAMREQAKLELAASSFLRAIELVPTYAQAHCNLGMTLFEMGQLDRAEASLRKAISIRADYAEAHNNLGAILKKKNKLKSAELCHRQAISLKPDYLEAHYNLGTTLKELGRNGEAISSFNQVISIEESHAASKHMLAALSGETPSTAPRDYVEALFDGYAVNFDDSLVVNLEYKVPRALAEMVSTESNFHSLASVLDLGCGTGLFGQEIRRFCRRLEGVDLSRKMLKKAQEKQVYDKLIKEDVVVYLEKAALNFNVFVFTDVFIYIGALDNVFNLIKSRTDGGGKLAFSTEHLEKGSFLLEESGRYSHSKKYILSLCERFGYTLSQFKKIPLRKDGKKHIAGALYVLSF